MSEIRIAIAIDNAAFEDDLVGEVTRILSVVSSSLTQLAEDGELQLRDINGNTVGKARVRPGIELTTAENAQALAEGWVLSTGQYGTIIERDDDQHAFDIDDQAELYVSRQAFQGSELHIRALAIHHASWAEYFADQAELRAAGYTAEELQAEDAERRRSLTNRPSCGHSPCAQHWIETGFPSCIALWACTECGCTDVQETAWIEMNGGEVQGDEGPLEQQFCPQCGTDCTAEQTAFTPKPVT